VSDITYEQLVEMSNFEIAERFGLSLTVPSDREGVDLEVRPRSYFIQVAVQQLAMEQRLKSC